ncbi:MAG TPA: bacillithiol biosynthesis BshC, partial [Segetibacter sp.]
NVPFPVLIVRNSFLLYSSEQEQVAATLGFKIKDLFQSTDMLISSLVKRESDLKLDLTAEKESLQNFYGHLQQVTSHIDSTLAEHTKALKVKALEKLENLEKKMLRSEKRKFEARQRQIIKLKQQLFPEDGLQERVDNFSLFYAKYGKKWLDELYRASPTLQQEFVVLELP